jgi:hypothetical protein
MTRTAHRQLPLWTGGDDWRLDDRTREVGRRGVAEARAALEAARRRAEARFPVAESGRAA